MVILSVEQLMSYIQWSAPLSSRDESREAYSFASKGPPALVLCTEVPFESKERL